MKKKTVAKKTVAKKTVAKKTVAKSEKKKVGRPPIPFDNKYCDLLISHMATGKSYETFGATKQLRISESTLRSWEEKYPEFSRAKAEGFRQNRNFWEDLAIDNLHSKTFNTTIWVFNMKNRFGWRDKVETQVSHSLSDQLQALVDKLPD